jgi:hypothetical protein
MGSLSAEEQAIGPVTGSSRIPHHWVKAPGDRASMKSAQIPHLAGISRL